MQTLKEAGERVSHRWYVCDHRQLGIREAFAPTRRNGIAKTLNRSEKPSVNVGCKKVRADPIGTPARFDMGVIDNRKIESLSFKMCRPCQKGNLIVCATSKNSRYKRCMRGCCKPTPKYRLLSQALVLREMCCRYYEGGSERCKLIAEPFWITCEAINDGVANFNEPHISGGMVGANVERSREG